MSKLRNPWAPDPKYGCCHFLGRNHSINDMTLNGNREKICRSCKKPWVEKK